MDKFEPQMGLYENGMRFINIKYDLYRLPSMIVDHLASLLKIKKNSTWEKIEAMAERKVKSIGQDGVWVPVEFMSQNGALNLKFAFSLINRIKLDNYLTRNCQDNKILFIEKQDTSKDEDNLFNLLGISKNDIFNIYYTILPFYTEIRKFVYQHTHGVLSHSDFYDDNEYMRGDIYHRLYAFSKAQACFENAIKKMVPPSIINKQVLLSNLGISNFNQGKYQQSLENFLTALQSDSLINYFVTPILLCNIGHTCLMMGEYERGKPYIELAFKIYQIFENLEGEARAQCLLGIVEHYLKNYSKAVEHQEASLKTNRKVFGKVSRAVGMNLLNLGFVYRSEALQLNDSRKMEEKLYKALDYYEKAFHIFESLLGSEHPETLLVLNNKAVAHAKLGKLKTLCQRRAGVYKEFNEAHHLNQLILSKWQLTYNQDHPYIAMCLNNEGRVYLYEKNYFKAKSLFEKAYEICQSKLGNDHPNTKKCLNSLNSVEECQQKCQNIRKKIKPKTTSFSGFFTQKNNINTRPIEEILKYIEGNNSKKQPTGVG